MTSYADYLLLLSPPAEVKEVIGRYKRACTRVIGDYSSVNSPAYITVCHLPRQKTFMTEPELLRLEPKLNGLPPVILHIDGFKYLLHPQDTVTIYAVIRSTPATDAWFKMLRGNLKLKHFVPHITIARAISLNDFKVLWPKLKDHKLVEPFKILGMEIVKRETFGSDRKWKPFKTVQFKGPESLLMTTERALDKPLKQDKNVVDKQQTNLF